MNISPFVGPLEPLEGFIALAESSVHERHRIRRDVPFPGNRFQRA